MAKERERKGLDAGEHLGRPLDALLILSAALRARGAALCAAADEQCARAAALHTRAAALCGRALGAARARRERGGPDGDATVSAWRARLRVRFGLFCGGLRGCRD